MAVEQDAAVFCPPLATAAANSLDLQDSNTEAPVLIGQSPSQNLGLGYLPYIQAHLKCQHM
jgi:hypothetical protein